MMDDASTIEELLAGQEVSNHHKVSMFSENIKIINHTTGDSTAKLWCSKSRENGGRERASPRTWTEREQLFNVKWSS